MNALDIYNIINKTRNHFPRRYHRPWELVFNNDLLFRRYAEAGGFTVPPDIVAFARTRHPNKDIIINVPKLLTIENYKNGKTGYQLPIKNTKEFISYVYLHECGHLASPKNINYKEEIADKFATNWFTKMKEKL